MVSANINLQLDCVEEAIQMLNSFSREFILKKEQEVTVKELLKRNDVLAILPTGFGKSLIYIVFLLAHIINTRWTDTTRRSSILVVSPLRSIVPDQIYEVFLFNCTAIEFSKETISEIGRFLSQFIYCSAESVLEKEFLCMLKDSKSELHKSVSAIVVDESHTVETWTGKR